MLSRLPLTGLYGIVGPPDGADVSDERLLALADALLAAGSPILQLRHKQAHASRLLALTRALLARTRQAGALLVINDRLDLALMAGADGVHLGQTDLPVRDARRVAQLVRPGEPFVIGHSTHDVDEVKAALAAEVDYVGFGPVFPTTTKADALATRGIERLAEAVRVAGNLPVVAIGGVTQENAAQVAAAGAAMGAVISDVARAEDPRARARALHAALSAPAYEMR